MTSGRYPDEADPEGLYTSEDLFGDFIDAPLEEQTPERPGGARPNPIRVQVSEPDRPSEDDVAVKAPVPAEDFSVLLDAFADPADVRATTAPSSGVVSPQPGAAEDPAPAAKAGGREAPIGEEDAVQLLASLEAAGPDDAPEAPAPTAKPAGRSADDEPWRLLAEIEAGNAPADPPAFKDEGIDSLMARLEPASSHGGAKFQASPPRRAAQDDAGLDLAAVAEDALAQTQPEPSRSGAAEGRARPPGAGAPTQYGPYRLLERVAVGGMAEVFKAKRSGVEGFEKVVAVKRILPHLSDNKEFVDMFVDEAKVVSGLAHPNIVQIYDLGKLEKSYYIAMEYVHGRDLRSIQKRAAERGIRIPLDLSVLIVGKVCAALEYAHRSRDDEGRPMLIVHRDISPQNILISFEGDVKLTDFGIAKAATKATTTDRGALRGKLLYMSPEQAWGKPIDRRSDVFSLGIVCYELLTDAKPFLGSSEMSILEMVRECRISAPASLNPRIPESLERIVLKALERDPELRYQDAAEMGKDLDRVLHERRPPAATELARLMELLFDEAERGVAQAADDDEAGAPAPPSLEVELEAPGADAARPAPRVPNDPLSVEQLLKRFGKR